MRGGVRDLAPGWKGSAVDTTTLPTCLDCGRPLALVTIIDKCGERPQVHVFNCVSCSRLTMFFLEKSGLRKW
jgi:hypothetical protein